MTLAASGAISLADIRSEYVGGSGSISLGDLYRGGSNVRAKSGDNQATNLAASVPASGAINLANFHGTAKGFKFTYSSTHGNQNFSSLFGDDWDLNYPKIVDINSGVSIYGSGTDAITIPSGLAGGLTLNNAGSIYGFGGAAGGGAGGNCINNAASGVVINNTGNFFAGGGGGANGAQGGNGSYTTISWGYTHGQRAWWCYATTSTPGDCAVVYGGSFSIGRPLANSTTQYGNYYKGGWAWPGGSTQAGYQLGIGSSASSSGGAGGAGGVGQGYNQSAGTGQPGASGGTNAGTGSNGTDGASYGQAATNSANGGNGNVSNGATGNTGGAAGAAVAGTSVTMNNSSGTIYGAVA